MRTVGVPVRLSVPRRKPQGVVGGGAVHAPQVARFLPPPHVPPQLLQEGGGAQATAVFEGSPGSRPVPTILASALRLSGPGERGAPAVRSSFVPFTAAPPPPLKEARDRLGGRLAPCPPGREGGWLAGCPHPRSDSCAFKPLQRLHCRRRSSWPGAQGWLAAARRRGHPRQ